VSACERESVCVREKECVSACVFVWEETSRLDRESRRNEWVYERERERGRERVRERKRERERERESVCV